MSGQGAQDHRRATAERNVEAILDAAERLLARHGEPSISAVAAEAGVSRPTVYAHFRDRESLVEALVARAVDRTTTALASAEPERGPAVEALRRSIAAGWEELGRNEEIARASAVTLSPAAMRRAHEAVRVAISELAQRGREEGAFRDDVPVGWLVTGALALIHAAAEEVREGGMRRDAALEVLTLSVVDLFTGPARHPGPSG